jgi:hypothetical protein
MPTGGGSGAGRGRGRGCLRQLQSHDPAISLVIAGPVANTEDAAREVVQDAMETVVARFQCDPADVE